MLKQQLKLSTSKLFSLKQEFSRNKIISLKNGWLNKSVFKSIADETNKAIKLYSNRVNIELNKSYRILDTVSGNNIRNIKEFPCINEFAVNEEILQFMKFICDESNLLPGKHDPLFPAHINHSYGELSHHGWHLDDAAYKIIIITQFDKGINETSNGGCLQYITNGVNLEFKDYPLQVRLDTIKNDSNFDDSECQIILDKKIESSKIKTLLLKSGDAYIINGRTVLHQILPINCNESKRSAICFSFDYIHDLSNYENSPTSLYDGIVQQDLKVIADHFGIL